MTTSPPALPLTPDFRSNLERHVALAMGEVLGRQGIGRNDDFFDLGGDSLDAQHLLALLGKHWGHALPERLLLESSTVAGLAAGLVGEMGMAADDDRWPHVVVLRAGAAQLPLLVVLPGGKGELLVMARLLRMLPTRHGAVGIDLRLMDPRLHRPRSPAKLAGMLMDELATHAGPRPLHVIGECVAGSLAFALVAAAKDRGHPVAGLTLLDHARPIWRRNIAHLFRARRKACRYLQAQIRWGARRWMAPGRNWPDIRHAFEVQRHMTRLRFSRPPLPEFPVDLIMSAERAAWRPFGLGWQGRLPGLRCHVVTGTHDGYVREHVGEAAKVLGRILDGADEDPACRAGGTAAELEA